MVVYTVTSTAPLATITERHHEQSRASVLAAVRISHHRTRAVINLRLFSRCGQDHGGGLRLLRAAPLVDVAFDALVGADGFSTNVSGRLDCYSASHRCQCPGPLFTWPVLR